MSQMKALRTAAPYLGRFMNKVFVVKIGGEVLDDRTALRGVADQLTILRQVGIRLVLVHGGGNAVDEVCGRLGIPIQKVAGRRITSTEAFEAAAMTLGGKVRLHLTERLLQSGLEAVSLTGLDGRLIQARRRPPVEVEGQTVDYGQVGDIEQIDSRLIRLLLDGGYIPVVAPITRGTEGEPLNTNADTVAAELAVALGAEKLVFVLGIPGLLRDVASPESLVPYLELTELEQLKAQGIVSGGMLPKLAALTGALERGVPSAHLISGRIPDALLLEIFTNEGSGTMIVRQSDDGA